MMSSSHCESVELSAIPGLLPKNRRSKVLIGSRIVKYRGYGCLGRGSPRVAPMAHLAVRRDIHCVFRGAVSEPQARPRFHRCRS